MHIGVVIVNTVTVNVDVETNIPMTLIHGRRKAKVINR